MIGTLSLDIVWRNYKRAELSSLKIFVFNFTQVKNRIMIPYNDIYREKYIPSKCLELLNRTLQKSKKIRQKRFVI